MNAIDQRLLALFQRLRCGHVGLDHEFLDQLMCIETRGHDNTVHGAILIEQNFALRQVEFQRLAIVAAPFQHGVGFPKRAQNRLQPRLGAGRFFAVDCCLRFLVGKPHVAFHHDAVKCVAQLPPCRGKRHANGQSRAVHILFQRTLDRWKCAPAASARRGRENRRNYPVCALPYPVPNRGAHTRTHRQSRR